MGILSLLCLFVCTVTDFPAAEKDSGAVRLLSGQVLSHFGEFWLAWSHGSGITSGMSYIEIAVRLLGSRNWAPWLSGQSESGAATWRKAVW